MHYATLAILSEPHVGREALEAAVEELYKPYGDGIEWDWYQIGGRWTGHFDGHEPDSSVWPTKWPFREEDAIKVSALTHKHVDVNTIVCSDGYGWFKRQRYIPWAESIDDRVQEQPLPPLGWIQKNWAKNGIAVIVDCHN